MLLSQPDDPLFRTLGELLASWGLTLVDLAVRTKNGTTKVSITLFDPQGLSIESLTKSHRMLLPKLEELLQTDNLFVEVGSPGLDRNLKYAFELDLFKGRSVKVLTVGSSEWVAGLLVDATTSSLRLEKDGTIFEIRRSEVLKARLNDL